MRYTEIINELLDQAADWNVKEANDHKYVAEFMVNDYRYVFDASGWDYSGFTTPVVKWEVSFGMDRTLKKTGTGNEFLVFATVKNILMAFINQCKPQLFWFSSTQDEPSRVRLYRRMADQIAAQLGFDLEIEQRAIYRETAFSFTDPALVPKLKESHDLVLGDTQIPFTLSASSRRHQDVLVDVLTQPFDAAWQKDRDFYIGPTGTGGIGKRYGAFGNFVNSTKEHIEASEVHVDDRGNVSFNNGRHRFAWLRDNGAQSIPVAMGKDALENARKFGYLA